MKFSTALLTLSAARTSSASKESPVGKVVQMIADLEAKVISEGEASQKIYEEFSEWCEDRASDLSHEIKTAKQDVETLTASIAEETAKIEELTAKIEELSGNLAVDESDLKAATHIRELEAADFSAEESELVETVSMLQRAVGILEREMAKGGSSMLQMQNVNSIAQALSVMVKASVMSSADASRLSALVQTSHTSSSNDDDDAAGAPAAAVYEGHAGDIIATLKGLLEEAESQLDAARKKETANHNNFQLLKQSITDEIRFGNQNKDEAKKARGAASEAKSTAEGDLQTTSKALSADSDSKAELHKDCMAKAEDFEAETKSRGEELKALATAKKAIKDSTGGAKEITYLNQVSFLQASRAKLTSSTDLANFEVVRFVRDLARTQNSGALAQLAQHIASAVRLGEASGAADPFAKVKGLISDMISKLEAEADADATEKAYCDKELRETREKKADKTAEIKKQTTRIDRMNARSATLKEQVAALQKELSKLAAAQVDMDKLRKQENSQYLSNKADMEKGIDGVKMALKVLNEYYSSDGKAHEASGAGSGIISLLEVVESDFEKQLAEIESIEEAAVAAYERETNDNQIEKTTKDKDVEHKSKESAYLDKESAELSTDREGVQAELDAVNEYLAKLEDRCIAKAETYAERKRRREAEIAGLKQALNILEDETALVQRRAAHKRVASLRGHM